MGKATEIAQHKALCEALLSLKAIGFPEPLTRPDALICPIIARGAITRVALAMQPKFRKGLVAQLLEDTPDEH